MAEKFHEEVVQMSDQTSVVIFAAMSVKQYLGNFLEHVFQNYYNLKIE